MIRVEYEEYCEDCPEFEPDMRKEVMHTDYYGSKGDLICETVIQCQHKDRCKSMKDFIERKSKNEKLPKM